MTRMEFVKALAKSYGISYAESKDIVDMCLGALTENLIKGEDIKLTGFGTFKQTVKNAKRTYDINTGNFLTSDSRKKIRFVLSENLEDKLNGEFADVQ
jgi:integration host factor subunit alpha